MFALEKKTLEAIMQYLSRQPWVEVKDLIPEVMKARPVTINEPPTQAD